MTQYKNNHLTDTRKCLILRDLGGALQGLESYLATRPGHADAERLQAIDADFRLMSDYWMNGFRDPQAEQLYGSMLRRTYVLLAHVERQNAIDQSGYLRLKLEDLQGLPVDWSMAGLRQELESHVQEVVMTDLEPEHLRWDKKKRIYQRHHQMMTQWFDYLSLGENWSDDDKAREMEEILLSPTVDSIDQQVLVSALTLNALNQLDITKAQVLLHVYQQSGDMAVKQRALVGWVMAIRDRLADSVYQEETREMMKALDNPETCRELVQLQQQIVYCMNAEKDHQTIQQEIMPDLLNNGGIVMTRNGIEQVERDTLEDILHPDEEERRMEQAEESFRKMQDMQQKGSDIYFGGFSQMKRFTFFSDNINWLSPFYIEHPGINQIVDQFRKNKFLMSMIDAGPFCNSDKYSFLLVFSNMISHVPESIRQVLERGEASVGMIPPEETQSATYIRRIYLQDLYRFFRLSPYKQNFHNPFEQDTAPFFANSAFEHTPLQQNMVDMAAFLLKQKRDKEAFKVLCNCEKEQQDYRYYMMMAFLDPTKSIEYYEKALELKPGDEKALQGLAKNYYIEGWYAEAIACYDQLIARFPEKSSYVLSRCVCLISTERVHETLNDLYRLNYESPDDLGVVRVLAWALTCDGQWPKALDMYAAIPTDHMQEQDYLNYGYSLWLAGNIKDAVNSFRRYLKMSGDMVEDIIEGEYSLLKHYGITETEKRMMNYVLLSTSTL